MKLNKRLLALAEMVKHPYGVVWDCCCDHGLLGFQILANGLVKQVNFVDVVPDIIDRLNTKLKTYSHHLPSDVQWQTFCADVADIPLANSQDLMQAQASGKPQQLVIISGVGGELMIGMLDKLIQRYNGHNIDYLLCPVHHAYKLRNKLVQLDFKLKQEQLITDNQREYELLLVNQLEGRTLSVTGNELWENTKQHQDYLVKLISHYQRVTKAESLDDLINMAALKDYALLQENYIANK
ncbi:tRNA (adenine(22)-N(1))-methyltransferase TrmK [Psychromonas algicola]|uniref:tRNA (adenine(22)-N(1))-methyltransferase TrmK n=1 Tax=Psychromonas algicola TaxID=2555642 RepID=UPI0010674EC7|nr:tRNA (adenine(22)-N(1))-methyltransferase TrmK [Psychromonas sp. RZ5]TEW52984.1 SAM-dependent methyltransferase [Psychromonas sp. RZ5]